MVSIDSTFYISVSVIHSDFIPPKNSINYHSIISKSISPFTSQILGLILNFFSTTGIRKVSCSILQEVPGQKIHMRGQPYKLLFICFGLYPFILHSSPRVFTSASLPYYTLKGPHRWPTVERWKPQSTSLHFLFPKRTNVSLIHHLHRTFENVFSLHFYFSTVFRQLASNLTYHTYRTRFALAKFSDLHCIVRRTFSIYFPFSPFRLHNFIFQDICSLLFDATDHTFSTKSTPQFSVKSVRCVNPRSIHALLSL